jgi:hypothetical protein
MRILGSIVNRPRSWRFAIPSSLAAAPDERRVIRDELVLEKAIFLQELAHLIEHHPRVPPSLDGTPEIDQVAIDLEMTSSRCEMK